MGKKKQSCPSELNGIEEWMNQFFQDPFTGFLDEYTFRVDLFETSCEYIIEAQLEKVNKNQIELKINKDCLFITIYPSKKEQEKKERSVFLPFHLEDKVIQTSYEKGILEVIILKDSKVKRKGNIIKIQ